MSEVLRPNLKKPLIVWAQLSGLYVSNDTGSAGNPARTFFEYWLAVPANRWGSPVYSAAQFKTIQEVITLIVVAGFSVLYLKQPSGWNRAFGFALIAAGAFFVFHE